MKPDAVGKDKYGNITLSGYALWWPLLLGYRFRLWAHFSILYDEPLISKITEKIYLGGWPTRDEHLHTYIPAIARSNLAVLDLTAELPRQLDFGAYYLLATWDDTAPPLEEFEQAVSWAVRQHREGFVLLVHCAFGHGRSCMALCAILTELQQHKSWRDALYAIQQQRPLVNMMETQVELLEQWEASKSVRKSSDVLESDNDALIS